MTLRNRELVNLLLVGLLTAAGFTAVYIARQDVVSAGSLSYAAFFLAVFVAAHVILRFGGALAVLGAVATRSCSRSAAS